MKNERLKMPGLYTIIVFLLFVQFRYFIVIVAFSLMLLFLKHTQLFNNYFSFIGNNFHGFVENTAIKSLTNLKGSHQRFSIEKGVLRNFTKLTRKHLCQKIRHRCFPVNFAKFLRTLFYRTPLDDCFYNFCRNIHVVAVVVYWSIFRTSPNNRSRSLFQKQPLRSSLKKSLASQENTRGRALFLVKLWAFSQHPYLKRRSFVGFFLRVLRNFLSQTSKQKTSKNLLILFVYLNMNINVHNMIG